MTGEMKPAPVRAAAQIEIAWARSLTLWVPAASIAIDVGKIAAAPMPEITWPVSRTFDPAVRREEPEQPADHHQGGTDGEQVLAAEQVSDDTEAELQQGHRHQEGVGDPGELGRGRPEVQVDVAVDAPPAATARPGRRRRQRRRRPWSRWSASTAARRSVPDVAAVSLMGRSKPHRKPDVQVS